ncbi:MAG: sodium:calcium antiporter [Methanocalculus sp. MSAO_Arc1]|uniref:cache domain-containing protein n=1 Tax=Methanocalculus TaxID=71151 RepID=UPI000FF596B0|nr:MULTISPECIES: cache domain-containing protein [unclassified Methanocalculus]MCP1661657.1 hypothetical protein [Methanocalculus sp. AMF5]RQD81919.1 MAG: sodium:calcium antiporter [Methanocalculus sp. MSAO_Arc1]
MRMWTLCILAWLILAASAAGCLDREERDETRMMEQVLQESMEAIESELNAISDATEANAALPGADGIEDTAHLLPDLEERLQMFPYGISTLIIGRDGVVRAAVPEDYTDLVGMDLSYQDAVERANTEQMTIVSDVFWLVEGFYGISQSSPIFDADGNYLGYTDITYRPEEMIGRMVEPIIATTRYDIWVIEKGGRVIYDTTADEIGRNIFTDPIYQEPGLQEAFQEIVSRESGLTTYTFWDRNWQEEVRKIALFGTVAVDGAEWRVVVTTYEGAHRDPAAETEAAAKTDADINNMKAFVAEAAAYARDHGREAALSAFNDPEGDFVRGELYIFAYAYDGTTLALPFQPGLVGENRRGIADPYGVLFIDGLCWRAETGGGSIYYVYPDPSAGFGRDLKLSYVQPVDETWFVGSGIYLSGIRAEFSEADRDALVLRVHHAREYANAHGKEEALAAFNDQDGEFGLLDDYIFAYGYDGTTLALPYQPAKIGSERLDFEDRYGVRAVAWEIMVAEEGGGFVYVTHTSPATGLESVKLCYVVPAGPDWLIGSGIYSGI